MKQTDAERAKAYRERKKARDLEESPRERVREILLEDKLKQIRYWGLKRYRDGDEGSLDVDLSIQPKLS